MTWADLLFVHWRVDPALMRTLVPAGLELDLFDASAWIGLVPFAMRDCAFRGVPRVGRVGPPGLRDFYECNVRTYVRHRGSADEGAVERAGVWFFSLDAATILPVFGGRWLWSLNYVWSRFDVRREGDLTDYRLVRRGVPGLGDGRPARTRVRWRVGEALPRSEPGSLEHFLTERYWLFTQKGFGVGSGGGRRIMAGEVRHAPWSLRRADVLELDDTLIASAGVRVEGAPVVLASDSIRVEGFGLV